MNRGYSGSIINVCHRYYLCEQSCLDLAFMDCTFLSTYTYCWNVCCFVTAPGILYRYRIVRFTRMVSGVLYRLTVWGIHCSVTVSFIVLLLCNAYCTATLSEIHCTVTVSDMLLSVCQTYVLAHPVSVHADSYSHKPVHSSALLLTVYLGHQ
jgi:hypothetical protein